MKDKIRGAIVGVAIGDSLGMPVESLHPNTIRKYFKWVNSYRVPNKKTRTFHNLKRGQWTDDTQLTLAIGESITEKNNIDYEDIANKHINLYLHSQRGWGRATRNGVENIINLVNWWDAGDKNAAGNGVVMKIAPIGILYGLGKINTIEMITVCSNISKMTHKDERAILGSIIHCRLIDIALNSGFNVLKTYLNNLSLFTDSLEDYDLNALSDRLDLIGPNICDLNDSDIRNLFGAGAFINESLPFIYAMIFKYGENLQDCIERIVNQGGDSDTNASIAASLLGACYGYSGFPAKWRKGLEERTRLINLADRLMEVRL